MSSSALLRGINRSARHRILPLWTSRLLATSQTPHAPQKESEQHSARSYQVLTKLAKAACTLREAISADAREQLNLPTLLLDLERDIDAAFSLVSRAEDSDSRRYTAEQLADRRNDDILAGLGNNLSYADMLQAQLLRDEIEEALLGLHTLPPADSLLEGAGRLPWKGSKNEKKKTAATVANGAANLSALGESPDDETNTVLKELHPVTEAELARRKKHMENATDVKQMLRGFDTALLEVGRVHKVVKGGTNMSMRALVAIGNRNGVAGFGEGKSETAQHAIERACRDAHRNLLTIDLWQDRTIQHRVKGSFVRTQVDVWPAPKGVGISACNQFAVILSLFGLKDVGAKLRGTRPLANSVKALFNALSQHSTEESIAAVRSKGFVPVDRATFGARKQIRIRGGL